MLEAPHPHDGAGVAAVVRVDLEHVAVLHAVDDLVGLLAGQPRAPRRRTAGAVVQRAGEAHPVGDEPAVAIDHQRRGAPVRLRVVDLLAQLVDEDQAGLALGHDRGELAQRLAHEARLHAHLRVAHLAFELRPRDERRHGVDDQHVHGARADEDLGDLERLLPAVRLRDEQVVGVDAELAGVQRVERVLGVHERRHAAALLRLGDDVQRQRRLARRLRAVDLDDAAAGEAAHAQRGVDRQRAGGDGGDVDLLAAAEPHDRALAELLVDLGEGGLDRLRPLVPVVCHPCSP